MHGNRGRGNAHARWYTLAPQGVVEMGWMDVEGVVHAVLVFPHQEGERLALRCGFRAIVSWVLSTCAFWMIRRCRFNYSNNTASAVVKVRLTGLCEKAPVLGNSASYASFPVDIFGFSSLSSGVLVPCAACSFSVYRISDYAAIQPPPPPGMHTTCKEAE